MDFTPGEEPYAFVRMECDHRQRTEAGMLTAGGKADCLHELYTTLPIARPFARRFWTLHMGTAAFAYTLTRPSSSAAL
jgi:hypothetical protein